MKKKDLEKKTYDKKAMDALVNEISSDWSEQLTTAIMNGNIRYDKNTRQYYFSCKEGIEVGVGLGKLKEAYEELEEILNNGLKDLKKDHTTFQQEKMLANCIYLIEKMKDNLIGANYKEQVDRSLENLKHLIEEKHLELQMEIATYKGQYSYTTVIALQKSGCISLETLQRYNNREMENGRVTPKEIIHLVDEGILNKEEACEMAGAESYIELYQEKKNTKYLKMLPEDILLRIFLQGKVSQEALSKTNISMRTIITLAQDEKITASELKQLIKKGLPDRMQPTSQELWKLYKEKKLTGRDILEMIQLGTVDDRKLMEVYQDQKKIKSAVLFPEAFQKEFITDDELLAYFSIEKIAEKKEEGKLTDEFWDMYHEILERNTEEASFRKQALMQRLQDSELSDAIYYFENGLVEIEDIKSKIEEEEVIQLKESGQIKTDTIFLLYQQGILSVDALSLIFDGEEEKIIQACKEGKLDESALEVLSKEEQKEEYRKGNLSINNILQLYNQGWMDVQDLKELRLPADGLTNYMEEGYPKEKVEELFLNRVIDYDSFASLLERGVLTQGEFVSINRKFNFKEAIQELRERQVKNNGIPEWDLQREGKKYTNFLESEAKKPMISIDSRLAFLKSIHCEDGVPIYRGDELELNQKAALEGYDYAINEEMGVIILEKCYEDNIVTRSIPAIHNATYILPPVKLIEYLEKRNKQDLRMDANVQWVNHTRNWGRNLLIACAGVGKQCMRTDLLKQYKEEIQLIQEEYDQNKKEEREAK